MPLLLAAALLLSPAAALALPAGWQQAEDGSAAGSTRVVAQGISRLPRGDIAWTVRQIDVPGGENAAVEEFPLGFAVAGSGTVALRDEDEEMLAPLGAGEAVFLPAGKGGSFAAQGEGAASLYEIALVSSRQLESGEAAGNVAGGPFAAPEGGSFDIELAAGTLGQGEQATLSAARSGAPALHLQTGGVSQLTSANGQAVELAAGQDALLQGDVTALGASAEPAAFVVAAIGEATGERVRADGTPEARAGRENRERAQGAGSGERQARQPRQRTPRAARGGRQGGQTQAPGTSSGGGGAPVTGGTDQPLPQEAGGTPAPEPTVAATLPPDTGEGTPTPEATTPAEEPTAEATVPPEATEPVATETPITEEPTAEPTLPPEGELPTEVPADEPVKTAVPEETVTAESIVEAPAEEAPVEIVEEPAAKPTPAG